MYKVFLLAILFTLSIVNGEEASTVLTSSKTTTDGGYYASLWTNGQGSVSMTLDGSNGYSITFSNVGDFTAGKGWNTGSGKTINFSGSYSNSGGGCFGIYGWTTNPLIEYYICEKVGNTGGPGQGTQMGTVTSDGGTYTIWKHQQVNQPSIVSSSSTFWQYISIRQSQRTSGTINIQNHFNAWASLGLNLGSMSYQIFLTESWSGSGSANAQISVGSSPPPNNPPPPPNNPPPPPPNNPPPPPPNPPPPSSGSCVVYSGGSSLSTPFSDWSFGGSVSYSGGAVILPIGSSWNALYARYSNGLIFNSNSAITFTAEGGTGSGNQNIQVYAVGNSGSAIGNTVAVSLAPNSYNSYTVSASQLGISGQTIYGIALQAVSNAIVHPSVSFTKIAITNANCGQSSETADAVTQKSSFDTPDMIGMSVGIVAAVLVVIVVIVVVIFKMRSPREEIV